MGDVTDIHNLTEKIQNERTRLEEAVTSGEIDERDRDAIIDFANHRELHEGVKNATR